MTIRVGQVALCCLIVALVSGGLSSRTEASPIVFSSRLDFESAVENIKLATFDTFRFEVGPPQPSFVVDSLLHIDAFGSYPATLVNGSLALYPYSDALIRHEGGSAITAFGFDVSGSTGLWLSVLAGPLCCGSADTFYVPSFVGMLFPEPVWQIGLLAVPVDPTTSTLPHLAIDNVAVATVPEPSTLLLLAGALTLLQAGKFVSTQSRSRPN